MGRQVSQVPDGFARLPLTKLPQRDDTRSTGIFEYLKTSILIAQVALFVYTDVGESVSNLFRHISLAEDGSWQVELLHNELSI